ncbi:hypothetical protein BGX38DRAFT_1162462 [Terfezia claveryi]|nr:hypothetical protein BGX38DRAFT_1162462 [Terfezia claveryi]
MSSTTTNTSTLLTDPILAPFLAPSFTVVDYVNSTLPPLLPPSTTLPTQPKHDTKVQLQQQLSQPSHVSSNHNALPLSQIHPKITALLSALDIQTHRLITHLQNLTDEILRVAPRLSYEVEVLRGGVVGLGEDLEKMGSKAARFSPSASKDSADVTSAGDCGLNNKPEALKRLETLSTIRARLEEVIAIFGEAMNWPLPVATSESSTQNTNSNLGVNSPSYYNLSPAPSPPPFIKEINKANSAAKAATKTVNPTAEISYFLAANLVPQARSRIQELRLLAGVFKGTIEGGIRLELVEELARKVREVEKLRDGRNKGFSAKEERMVMPQRARKEEAFREEMGGDTGGGRIDNNENNTVASGFGVGREGYYGLINQLQRMRGMG